MISLKTVLLILALILGAGVIPAFAVTAHDIYQKDHIVQSQNVCGDQLCKNSTFGNGGPHFSFNPHLAVPANVTGYSVTIILPDNSFEHITGILSPDNFTALKNNIATMAVVNITPVHSNATLNYCPVAKDILLGQDGYMGLIYNATTNKDLTSLVYPAYCTNETGANPYKPIPVPEFPTLSFLVMGIAVITAVSIGALYNKTR